MKVAHNTALILKCAICGRDSARIVIPFYYDPESRPDRWAYEQRELVKEKLDATGYLQVKLYDGTTPVCCRECGEHLLGRRSVPMEGGNS